MKKKEKTLRGDCLETVAFVEVDQRFARLGGRRSYESTTNTHLGKTVPVGRNDVFLECKHDENFRGKKFDTTACSNVKMKTK